MTDEPVVLRVAVPTPVYQTFDYLPPPDSAGAAPGIRVRVPFGRRRLVGVVIEVDRESAVASDRLRHAELILDHQPVIPPDLLALVRWSAGYYHHPLGEVVTSVMPAPLRQGRPPILRTHVVWRTTAEGRDADAARLRRARRQAEALRLLQAQPDGLADTDGSRRMTGWRRAITALESRGWAERAEGEPRSAMEPLEGPGLNERQAAAAAAVEAALGTFAAFLLDGVTGSGKTEVYLQAIRACVASGGQTLVLVPEIALTPQIEARFADGLGVSMAVLHSGLTDRERLQAWLRSASGDARVIVGTRSAVFTPMPALGLVIIDEEHDASFKQHEGFRYSGRDVAIKRAHDRGCPVMLGSATPSLESLHNARTGRYRHLHLPDRASAGAQPPLFRLLDLRGQAVEGGLSAPLLTRIGEHLNAGGQVLLFLNRRGFAPMVICHDCGWVAPCKRCDARMTLHQPSRTLRCHYCAAQRPVERHCPDCGSVDLRPVGQGTQRVEATLAAHFPRAGVARMDRDTTRTPQRLKSVLDSVRDGRYRILLGTQMLAKGHDFPEVTLAGIIDADQGLVGVDFRGAERMAQLIIQVAGRAGRREHRGEVVIQTRHPEHGLLRELIDNGYPAFADGALAERDEARLPPFTVMALLRAEATRRDTPLAFLTEARAAADAAGVELLGPVPAPMERRAGRYRAQLLLQADARAPLQALLRRWVPALGRLPSASRVRWSVDVDPVELA